MKNKREKRQPALVLVVANFSRDLRFALRQLACRPALSLFMVLTLAAAIGPNVAIFSVLKALVLQPFYYPDAGRLVQVWETDIAERGQQPFTSPDYFDMREQNTTFKELGVYTPLNFNLSDGEAERIQGVACTASVLRAYAVMPAMGRFFTDEEEQEGRNRVVIISDELWKSRYGSNPQIIGRKIRLNAEEHEIIGVMPRGYQFSSPWYRGVGYELWTPIVLSREESQRGSHSLLAVGRLKDDVNWLSAQTELQGIAKRLAEAYPKTNARTQVWLMPFALQIMGRFIGQLFILSLTVGFVLLVGCANIASILLARGAARQTEIAVRISLGAGRRRIVGQLLSESLLLAVLGGIAAVILASWSLEILRSLIPQDLPGRGAIGIDRPVLIFTFVLSALAAMLFGLVPALTASKIHIVEALKEGSGTLTAAGTRNRLLRFLAVAQIALALMLANGAILLFKSYRNVLALPQGFHTGNVLTAEIWLWGPRYEGDQPKIAFWEHFLERVRSLPGVAHAALTTKLPLEGGTNGSVLVEGENYDPQVQRPLVEQSWLSSEYFDVMGIPLLAGRALTRADEAAGEMGVVVNRAFVDRYWPGQDALGKRIRNNGDPLAWTAEVVGVAENVRQWGAITRPLPEMYRPYGTYPKTRALLVLQAETDPLALVPAIRRELADIDADLPLANIRTMEDVYVRATQTRRFITLLLDLFTVIALFLAVSGIYGFVSYHAAQRRHEFGIRLALGASKRALLTMVIRHSFRLVLNGITVGLAMTVVGAVVAGRWAYGVSPLHPLYLAGGALCVILVSMLASLIPAIRATQLDPVRALRTE